MSQKNLIELLKTADGATTCLIIRVNAGDLLFLDPNATHVKVVMHPTQNRVNLEITGAERGLHHE